MTPHWPGLAGNASRSSARAPSWWTNMSAWAAVGESTPRRPACSATACHTSCWATPRASASSPSARALRSRSSGPAVCAAAAKVAERRRQRPASTQLTGIGVTDASASSTVRLRMRFCLAPTSSSPS